MQHCNFNIFTAMKGNVLMVCLCLIVITPMSINIIRALSKLAQHQADWCQSTLCRGLHSA